MKYNKIDFINDLLSSKKIKVEEKIKILDLTKRELKNFDSENEEISKRIGQLEEKIKILSVKRENITNVALPPKQIPENGIPIYLDPKNSKDFLVEYNQHPLLKYTCHTVDNNDAFQNILNICETNVYNIELILNQIHGAYKKLTYKYKDKVSKNVIALIGVYLGTHPNKTEWSEGISIRWNSPLLIEWAKNNHGKVPNPLDEFQKEKFTFKTIELKNGNTLTNFSELVIFFKNLFHFKSSNKLKDKIEEVVFLNFNNDSYSIVFDEDFLHDIELFTYSDSLMQGFVKIIKMSKQLFKNDTLRIKLCLGYDENSFKELKIIILNSKKFTKHFNALSSNNSADNRGRYGDDLSILIDKSLNGICNFFIKAEFEDKKSIGIVNIWDDKPLTFTPIDNEIEGVEFILKMY